MREDQLCTIYIACPHCYCMGGSKQEDSDASGVYLCSFRRCPQCYCTSDDTMSSNEEEEDMWDVEIGEVHVKVEGEDMGVYMKVG